MVTEQVGRTNAWYAALVIYGYWLPVENDFFFHKKPNYLKKYMFAEKIYIAKVASAVFKWINDL